MIYRYLAGPVVGLLIFSLVGCAADTGQWTSSRASHMPVAPESQPWQFQATQGRIIETAHYRVYTTVLDAALLEDLPDFLEATYQQYSAFLPGFQADDEPMDVYLFGRRSEWETYTKENMGASAENYLKIRAGGYSYDGTSVTYLLQRYYTFGVLAHEGFHQFASTRLEHRIPAWMEEGLACNFESHVWKAGKPYFIPDLNEFRLQALKRALRRDSLFALEELLAMHAGDAVGMPAERTATFYAQAWALTRFLQEGEGGKYRQAFHQMLADAADGANLYSPTRSVDIFESYFKTDIGQLDREFNAFARVLADRQLQPGMEAHPLGSEGGMKTVVISRENIEQAENLQVQGPAEQEVSDPQEMPATEWVQPAPDWPQPETLPSDSEDGLIIRIEE